MSAPAPLPTIWADWEQREPDGTIWTTAEDADEPALLRIGGEVLAGTADDVRLAVVVDMKVERWRTLVWVREAYADDP